MWSLRLPGGKRIWLTERSLAHNFIILFLSYVLCHSALLVIVVSDSNMVRQFLTSHRIFSHQFFLHQIAQTEPIVPPAIEHRPTEQKINNKPTQTRDNMCKTTPLYMLYHYQGEIILRSTHYEINDLQHVGKLQE